MSRGPYVEGWKSIAAHCGRSERWCRDVAKRKVRPLPVGKVGGLMRMYLAAYETWLAEEMSSEKVSRALGW